MWGWLTQGYAGLLVQLLPCLVMIHPWFCMSEMVMWSSLPLQNGLADAALAGAVALGANGQDLTEMFEALYTISRWYLQVKVGTKEQGLVFSPARTTHQVSNLYPNPEQVSPYASHHHVPWGCRSRTSFQTPDHNTQTWQAGRKEQKLLPRLCWCAVICWLPRQAHTRLPDRAIQPSGCMHWEGQDVPPPPSSPPTCALIWSKFNAPRSCQVDSRVLAFNPQLIVKTHENCSRKQPTLLTFVQLRLRGISYKTKYLTFFPPQMSKHEVCSRAVVFAACFLQEGLAGSLVHLK